MERIRYGTWRNIAVLIMMVGILQEAGTFMPDLMDISGECWEDESKITLGWKGFTLNMYFSKVKLLSMIR